MTPGEATTGTESVYPFDIEGTYDAGCGHALRPVDGGDFLWWHEGCADPGWLYVDTSSGTRHHVISGSVEGGDITIRASLLCPTCGRHGFITDGRWHA